MSSLENGGGGGGGGADKQGGVHIQYNVKNRGGGGE